MTTTDKDRKFSRDLAEKIVARHKATGSRQKYAVPGHLSEVDMHYRGILAECEFSKLFKLPVNEEVRGTDGGIDFRMWLVNWEQPPAKLWPIDVKASAYNGPDARLKVPINQLDTKLIYVAGHYSERDDSARLKGWTWGTVLLELNDKKTYQEDGLMNYTIPFSHVNFYGIDQLEESRFIGPLLT